VLQELYSKYPTAMQNKRCMKLLVGSGGEEKSPDVFQSGQLCTPSLSLGDEKTRGALADSYTTGPDDRKICRSLMVRMPEST
jgi:hypothetical protein